jgi:aspartate-semialdehyde dehydrogenase
MFNATDLPHKIPVGILGATGAVGQRFVQLLENHPWFEVRVLAASDQSTGRVYEEACHWLLTTPVPEKMRNLVVLPVEPGQDLMRSCRLVFSALPSSVAGLVEEQFAQAGYAVCSNAASHRMDADVPLLIPEVNPGHTHLIEIQRQKRGWDGFIVTNPNCSSTQLALVLRPLLDRFGLRKLAVVTMQAVSGAGYPGLPALDILGNVIPLIEGEEDKLECEPNKLLGKLENQGVARQGVAAAAFITSAQCNRVAVRDGHTECVSIEFEIKPSVEQVIEALKSFQADPGVADLPSSPAQPILVHREADRPQPALDISNAGGMVTHVGRVRTDRLLDVRLVVMGHNTVRGAAGGSIHNAELLVSQGWIR